MSSFLIVGLLALFLLLVVIVFRPPLPDFGRLLAFVLMLGVAGYLGLIFAQRMFGYDPDPDRLRLAHRLTDDKIIDLTEIVPGLPPDLDMIHRVDTDQDTDDQRPEWLVFYRYDTIQLSPDFAVGPFGAAVYDVDRCRPPAILSYELAPSNYDYLGQSALSHSVDNIITFADPESGGLNRPELIIAGSTAGTVTDLNIFRKVGVDPNCLEIQAWRLANPGQIFPYAEWLSYDNVGSFRGNFQVKRVRDTVSVLDRAPFERSQIVIKRDYRPQNGSYFRPGTQSLLDPVEFGLTFGYGTPTEVPKVYYPEKAVLAFYEALTRDSASLARAKNYLSSDAQEAYDINTDTFGLYAGDDSVAQAREDLARVLVWEIRYEPDRDAERLHEDRQVTVEVVGVNASGAIAYGQSCQVTWRVVAAPDPKALPYGCEWRLDRYQSTCPGPGEHGQRLPGVSREPVAWVPD